MSLKLQRFALALALFVFGSVCQAGTTTVINFDSLGLPNYGHITDYGTNAPNTPDIAVSYRTFNIDNNSTYTPYAAYWNTGYGSLNSVAFAVQNGYGAEMGFTVAAGHEGTINSFVLAALGGQDITDDFVRILDSHGNQVWSSNDLTVSGSTYTSYAPDYTFTGSVFLQFGANWNIGINNISISETTLAVPEPSSIVLAGMAMGMIGVVRLRRRAR